MHGMSLRPYEYKPMGTFLSAFYIHVVRQLIFYMTRHSISYIPFHILRGRNMNDINNMVLFSYGFMIMMNVKMITYLIMIIFRKSIPGSEPII